MAAITGTSFIRGLPLQEFVGEEEAFELAFRDLSCSTDNDCCGPNCPNLENHFLLNINEVRFLPHQSHGVLDWINPFLGARIKPYIPSENDKALVDACEGAFKNNHNAAFEEATLCKREIAIVVLAHSDLKALIAFSRASKSFYWLTKSSYNPETKEDTIWDTKISQSLSKVKRIALEKTIFSPEQQYKIVVRRFREEAKPYTAKFDRVRERSLGLKKELHEIWTQLYVDGGQEKLDNADALLHTKRGVGDATPQAVISVLISPEIVALRKLKDTYEEKLRTVTQLSGSKYNGTRESIRRTSELDQFLNVINVLIPEAFNEQSKFEQVIQESEAVCNTTSASSRAVIEDDAMDSSSDDDASDEDPGPQTLIPFNPSIRYNPQQ